VEVMGSALMWLGSEWTWLGGQWKSWEVRGRGRDDSGSRGKLEEVSWMSLEVVGCE